MSKFLTGITKTLTGPIGGILSGGLNLLTQGLQNKQQRQNMRLQNQLNMGLAEYQFGKNMEAWNLQNQYNSPEAQMARFKSAGLNPNLIYEKGTAGMSSSVPVFQKPEQSAHFKQVIDMPQVLSAYQDFAIKNAQLDNLKAQRRVIEAQALRGEAEKEYYGDNAMFKNSMLQSNMYQQMTKSLWAQFEKDLLWKKTYNDGRDQHVSPRESEVLKMSDAIMNKMQLPVIQLQKYNTDIAIQNSRKDLIELEKQFYMSPFMRKVMDYGGTFLRGLTK